MRHRWATCIVALFIASMVMMLSAAPLMPSEVVTKNVNAVAARARANAEANPFDADALFPGHIKARNAEGGDAIVLPMKAKRRPKGEPAGPVPGTGRRANAAGTGTLVSIGTFDYQVTLALGSPPTLVDLTIDTGSANMVAEYPSAGSATANCGLAQDPLLVSAGCEKYTWACPPGTPAGSNPCCGQGAYVTQGSYYLNQWCKDRVVFGPLSIEGYIAAVWAQNSVLGGTSQGIVGLGFSVSPPDTVTSMINSGAMAPVFGIHMCPISQGNVQGNLGSLVLGAGADVTCAGGNCGFFTGPASGFQWTNFYGGGSNANAFYQIDMIDVKVAGTPLLVTEALSSGNVNPVVGLDGKAYLPGQTGLGGGASNIVDSGWSGFGLNQVIIDKMATAFDDYLPGVSLGNVIRGTATVTDASAFADMPTITVVLPGASGGPNVELTLTPELYMVSNLPQAPSYSFIGGASSNGNAVGNSFIQAYYAVFDRGLRRIGFAPSDKSACPAGTPQTTPQCSAYDDCASCGADTNCGWCVASATCMTQKSDVSGPEPPATCSDDNWNMPCLTSCLQPSCAACTNNLAAVCGWCYGSADSVAQCGPASQSAPSTPSSSNLCDGSFAGSLAFGPETGAKTCPAVVTIPTISVASSSVFGGEEIRLSCATPGATVYSTTDGTQPSTSSATVTQIVVPTDPATPSLFTIRAFATKSGMDSSWFTLATYDIVTTTPTPTLSPGAATFSIPTAVTIACAHLGATIRYTTDGSEVTTSSVTYTAPVPLNSNGAYTINAVAWVNGPSGLEKSSVATGAYVIDLIVQSLQSSPAPGTGPFKAGSTSVTLSTLTSTANIFYTTDGTTPTSSSTLYSGPLPLRVGSTVIKAIGIAVGMKNSPIFTSSAYVVKHQVIAPTLNPAPGTFTDSVSITVRTPTAGAGVYYSTDQSQVDPHAASTTGAPKGSASPNVMVISLQYPGTWYVNTQGYLISGSALLPSEVVSGTYVVTSTSITSAPTLTPHTGDYYGGLIVTMKSSSPNSKIYYTMDGSVPTTSSAVADACGMALVSYNTKQVSMYTTVSAMAVSGSLTASVPISREYLISPAPGQGPTKPTCVPPTKDHDNDKGGKGTPTWVIVVIVVAIALVIGTVLAIVIVRRRRGGVGAPARGVELSVTQ